MRAIIVSGGTPPSEKLLKSYIQEGDLIIGVDKGCNTLVEYDIHIDLALGDFDSINKDVYEVLNSKNTHILTYNSEKDYSDTHLGYITAIENGADKILLFGATGTRVDHMLGNLGLFMNSIIDNVHLEIIDDNNRMFVVNKEATFKGSYGETISFHALSDEVKKLNIIGGKYKLKDYDMKLLEPRAICNEFLDEDIRITFESGVILVNFPKD